MEIQTPQNPQPVKLNAGPDASKASFNDMMKSKLPENEKALQQVMVGQKKETTNEVDTRNTNAVGTGAVDAAAGVQAAAKPAAGGSGGAESGAADPDADFDTGKKSPKTEDWRRVKSAAQAAAKERDEIREKWEAANKEIAEYKKAPKPDAEVTKKLQEERDTLKSQWESVQAQFDPNFRAKYDGQIGETLKALAPMLPADRADKIAAVLQMNDGPHKNEQLRALTEDLDNITAGEIVQANREIRSIKAAEKAELAKSGEVLAKTAEARKAQAMERQKAEEAAFEQEFNRRSAKDSKDALPVYQMREGDDEATKAWNAGVQERQRVAREIAKGNFSTPAEKAEAAMWAAAAPGFLQELRAARAEADQLRAHVAKLQGTSPAMDGKPVAPAANGGKKQLKSTVEAMLSGTKM